LQLSDYRLSLICGHSPDQPARGVHAGRLKSMQGIVNGIDVLDGNLRADTASRGHIGLQLYNPGVTFRNLRPRGLGN
jgi:hypothetical protein